MLRPLAPTLLVTLIACSGTSGPLDPPRAAAEPQGPVAHSSQGEGRNDTSYKVRLRLVVEGDRALGPLEMETDLRVIEFHDPVPMEGWFYQVGPLRPITLEDGRILLFAVDFSPGLWRGPGTYTLSEEAGITIGGTSGLPSSSYVQLYSTEDRTTFRRYDRFVQPCDVTIQQDDLTGQVSCPELEDEEGRTVSLYWNWERL